MSETIQENSAAVSRAGGGRVGIGSGASALKLLPIMAMVFVGYLIVGVALPVLPLYVHNDLGFGTFAVGVVVGSQFASALFTRMWAGHFVDVRGAKSAVVIGLLGSSVVGLLYLISSEFVDGPAIATTFLVAGRVLLGGAESFIVTGSLSWGLAILGQQNTGKVMAWVGTALYAALAVGAPVGTALYSRHGFAAIAIATKVIPLVTLALAASMRSASSTTRNPATFSSVARIVWKPGSALALSGVGFGAITTFIVLLFAQRGWASAWLAFSTLGVAFIVGRVVFGHLPDKLGGAKVALVCMLIEAMGQILIWRANSPMLALAGVTLTGLGYSLVFPGLGVEALRHVPQQSRGLAMGTFTSFLDLSLGLSGPALGLVASEASLSAIYLVSTLAVICAGFVTLRLMTERTAALGMSQLEKREVNEVSFRPTRLEP
jgi:MFS family permease